MNDKTHALQIRSLPDGSQSITVDGVPVPTCDDIMIHRRQDGKFHATVTFDSCALELDVEAMTEIRAKLRYSGPLDGAQERLRLECNTSIRTPIEESSFDRLAYQIDGNKLLPVVMELPELLAIVERWQGRQPTV